jgi:hypothetical protein
VTALWSNHGAGWTLLEPSPFDAEASLHSLVEDAPHVLPLSGTPRLAILGREVPLGSGYADLLAVETSGRLALVEVKLAKNAEARRAVVAQVLAYAAFLHGLDVEALERDVLGPRLRGRGFESVQAAAAAVDQEGAFDAVDFQRGLEESLASGTFRLVLVLDEAPAELVRLVGFLEHVGGELVIDLVTVSSYRIGGAQVLVPQRVEPDRAAREVRRPESAVRKGSGYEADGADDFVAGIDGASAEHQPQLRRLADWAMSLEREGLVRLTTYHGKGRLTLLPRVVADDAGLVTIWNDNGPYLSLWRSVFERRAPQSIERVEELTGTRIGAGNTTRDLRGEVLDALTDAYREAVGSHRSTQSASTAPTGHQATPPPGVSDAESSGADDGAS